MPIIYIKQRKNIMAIKTKVRLAQVSGSMPSDGESAAASSAIAASDLGDILDHMASAIKRIHGNSSFTEGAAGTFYQDLVIGGTTPTLTIGDAGAEDTMIVFDGNAQDYRIGLDDGTDILEIGVGSAHGTTTAMTIDASQQVVVKATTAASSTTDGALAVAGGLSVAADAIVGDDVKLLSDSAVLSLGAGSDATLTHDGTTGLVIAAEPISINSTGDLTLDSTTDIVIDAAGGNVEFKDDGTLQLTLDMDTTAGAQILKLGVNGDRLAFQQFDGTEVLGIEDDASLKIAGGLGSGGVTVTAAGALAADGVIKTDDTTEATSTTDGSLQTDGGLSVAKSAVIGDDLDLLSDSAIMNFGAGKDITFTHDGGTGMDVVAAGAFDISAGAASTWKTTAGALTVSAEADAAASLVITGSGIKIDGSAGRGITIGDTAGCAVSLGNAVSEVTVNDNLTVTGDLTVNGATVTVDTTNLTVQDPVITLNEGGQASNANQGLLFTSGSSSATKPGVAFGRVANDTWGLGTIAVPSSGTMTTVAGMTTSDMALRAGKFELDSSSDYIELDTNVKIVAAADIILDPAGNNVLPGGDSADSLGASGTAWAALYVDNIDLNGQGSISVGGTGRIDLDGDDDTSIRASADDIITFEAGGSDRLHVGAAAIYPETTDEISLGTSSKNFSDLFLDSGAVINFDGGDVTLTHSAGALTVGGDGTVGINLANHEMTNVDIDSGAIDGTTVGAASAAAGTFTTLDCTDGAFAIVNLDIDGGTDIGAALADADLIMVDDGAGGTNRKSAVSRVATYVISKRSKAILSGTSYSADADVNTGLGSTWTDAGVAAKEVYVNGQLLTAGNDAASNGDWYPGGSAGRVKFEFALLVDDIVTFVVWG